MIMESVLWALTRSNIEIILIVLVLTRYVFNKIKFNKSLPPGPWGIPYLGCLLFMSNSPSEWYLQKSKEYGDIFSVKLGNNLVVCISSSQLLKELFYRLDSTGRPHTPLNNLLGGNGIILSEGALWKKHRLFLHEKFRDLGITLKPNQRFEKFILMEIDDLFRILEKSNGKAVDPAVILGRHIHNVICQLMMSHRFEENDKDFLLYYERIIQGMELYGAIHIGDHVPHYLKLPGKRDVLRKIQKNLKETREFHLKHLKHRVAARISTTESYEPVDLLDHYLERIDQEKKNKNLATIFPDTNPEDQIIQVMNDLFSAGMETSRATILWCLIMMLREKEAAKKVRQELNKVVQIGQVVTLQHRLSLPYTEAVIFETLRYVSVVPLGTTHVNTRTWYINNYTIPAGSHIVPLLNKMGMDPSLYPEPHKFKPERFIEGGKFHASETFMQFGVGQRVCLGSQLARMELFLFLANIMNKFEFSLPDGEKLPELKGTISATHAPGEFKLCFKKLEV